MKKMSFAALGLAGALLLAAPAQAHFMMAYTPQTALEKAADLDFRIVFTHPAEAGHMMDMGGVKEFYALHQRGDGEAKKIDFKPLLKEITWKNPDSSAPAFSALVPRKELRSMGDYMFVMVPGYYYEKEEDVYMQQITKLLVNVGGIPAGGPAVRDRAPGQALRPVDGQRLPGPGAFQRQTRGRCRGGSGIHEP